jgi:hypothetical protein
LSQAAASEPGVGLGDWLYATNPVARLSAVMHNGNHIDGIRSAFIDYRKGKFGEQISTEALRKFGPRFRKLHDGIVRGFKLSNEIIA